MPLLVMLSVVAWFSGMLMLTQATYGVGFLCAACALGIYARLVQAAAHHKAAEKLDVTAPTA